MVILVPSGEGSSHNTVISREPPPLEEHRDFLTVGEIVKRFVSPHREEPNEEIQETRREVREILVGTIAVSLDGGPPRTDAVSSRRNSRLVTPQPQNPAEIHPMPIRNIGVIPESVNRNRFLTGSQVIIPNHLLHIRSGQANDLWVGPFTVERCIDGMCFLTTGSGRRILYPVHQRDLRDHIPDPT
jgi:hypothetical protein